MVSVEPLGEELPLYDITTGTGDFIANGVISHNCFARPTHEYLDFDAGRDFEKEIVVKVNVPEVLRKELARPSWKREHIAMGTNTDPYQWVEGRYKLMRGIWEAMRDFANPCSILTKSPLLLRDLDLMREVAAVTDLSACLSVPTLDEKAWRASEPHTPHPRARLEAVGELNRAGIPTGHPDRAADAGDQRRPGAGRADHRDGDGERRGLDRRQHAVPARRGAQDLHGLAAGATGPTSCRATRSSTPAARTSPSPSAAGSSARPGWPAHALKPYPERFKHRIGMRRPEPPPPAGAEGGGAPGDAVLTAGGHRRAGEVR